MSEKLRDFFVSFDSFGEPISVNYKGETSYKTGVGALFSLVIKSFLLIYATQKILTLFNYEEPAITQVSLTAPKLRYFPVKLFLILRSSLWFQYTVLSKRTEGDTLNLAENHGHLAFFLQNPSIGIVEAPDPRFITINAFMGARNLDFTVKLLR